MQAWNTFLKLDAMGFGLNELQQLKDTVSEIAAANNISEYQAVSRFLRDVQEQYNRKLGFDGKVSEKRKELDQINSKITYKVAVLQLNSLTAKTLHSLLQNGVSEQDIIEFGQLTHEYKSNNSSISSSSFGLGPNDRDNKTAGLNQNHQLEKRSDIGKSLTDDLKKYGGIKLAIKEQSKKLDMMKQEIKDLDKQKQGILAYCHLAIALNGIINYKIAYLKVLKDHHFKEYPQNQINPTTSSPMLIFVIYDKSDSKEKGEEREREKNKHDIKQLDTSVSSLARIKIST